MSDLKEKTKDQIDAAAKAAKKATDNVGDKVKDAAHSAGKKMEMGRRN